MKIFQRRGTILAAAVITLLGLVGGAVASPVGYRSSRRPEPVPTSRTPQFAGYQVNATGPAVTVTTTVVVPRVKRCGSGARAIAAGVDALSGGLLASAGVSIGCASGKARYYPVMMEAGTTKTYPSLAARPGDKVTTTIHLTAGNGTLSVVDLTHKRVHKTMTVSGSIGTADPQVGELKLTPAGIPSFGKLSFSGSKLMGQPFGDYAGELIRYDMATGAGTVQIKTGNFARGQESFAGTFEHS